MYFIPRFGSLQSLLEDWKDVVTIKKTCGVEFAMRHICCGVPPAVLDSDGEIFFMCN